MEHTARPSRAGDAEHRSPRGGDPARGRSPTHGGSERSDSERGAVTVEAAIALAALAVAAALAISGIVTVAAAIRCSDAAREAVRLTARGEPDRARHVALTIAPRDATVELSTDGDTVTALVAAPAAPPLPFRVNGRAVGVAERGAAGTPPGPGGQTEDAPPGSSEEAP